jgi:hypothetical protein
MDFRKSNQFEVGEKLTAELDHHWPPGDEVAEYRDQSSLPSEFKSGWGKGSDNSFLKRMSW